MDKVPQKGLDNRSRNEYNRSQKENSMLESLIASKTRRVLLNTFFSNPSSEYYTRQLSTLHRISAGTVHREVRQLVASGLLNERSVGNIKLFTLNKRNPVYEEIKNIINKTEGVTKLVKEAVGGVKGVKVAFIYGSYAKGDQRQDSDIDIFLIGDKLDERKLVMNLNSLERKLFREINYTQYTEREYKKEKHKNSFISEVIKGRKVFIKGGDNDL